MAKAAHAPRGGKWTKWRCLPRRMAHGPNLSTDFAVLLSKQHAWSDLKQVPAQDVAAHMERIDKLLTEYVQATLMGDTAWYKQPCVSSDYACPARIGNFMHHYLNALAFATTRNVPFAWSQSWKYQVEPCDTYIKRSSWLNNVRLHSTTDRCAKRSTCRLGDALAEVSNSSFEQRLACVGTRQLRRCDTENDLIVLSSKGAERFDSMELAALGAGCSVRFQHGTSRAAALFALGPHYLFGRLFTLSFEFDAKRVLEPVEAVLQSASSAAHGRPPLLIAAHIRHRLQSFIGTEAVDMYKQAVQEARRRYASAGQACIVLLATDRRLTLSAFVDALQGSECQVVSIPRPPGHQNVSRSHRVPLEHGEDAGEVAMQDLALLSRADVLLGSFGSTFTMLLGELIAANYRRVRTSKPWAQFPVMVLCDHPGASGQCTRGLPLIGAQWHVSLGQYPRTYMHMGDDLLAGCPTIT